MASMIQKRVSVLGATGSVGLATIDLVERAGDRFCVEAIAGGHNAEALASVAKRVNARFIAIADPTQYQALKAACYGSDAEIAAGPDAVIEAAKRDADVVVAAVVGIAGLASTLAACRPGVTVAIANKEALVSAGPTVLAAAKAAGATILPVDSEHSALFQAYEPERAHAVETLTLTASGGPFRTWTKAEMRRVRIKDALKHPNWDMGAKITIDSATMMNKGLELIEAARLFPLTEDQIDIVVHPQSIIHGLVAYRDGSVIAQMGAPDMRAPIAVALAWPDRMPTPVERLDLVKLGQMTFEAPDLDRFPALDLARAALRTGGCRPAVLNAANEIAVAAFLARRISFLEIAAIVAETLETMQSYPVTTLAEIMVADAEARRIADIAIDRREAA
jgi:1-deoxy-D-xylulose-5-phosphate reductoisomerase